MKTLRIATILLWPILTFSMIFFGRQAQDFAVAGAFGIGVLFGIVLHLYVGVLLIAQLYRRSKKKISVSLFMWQMIFALLVGDIAFATWQHVDNRKVAETMEHGDQIIAMIEEHKKATGKYPSSLNELADTGKRLPVPALKNTAFEYTVKSDDTFAITFNSVAWLICTKHNTEPNWKCDD